MRSLIAISVLAGLVAAPLALAGHPVSHVPTNELEPALALAEMATDGYVFQITRPSSKVFEVRVLHRQSFFEVSGFDPFATPLGQYGLERADLLGPASRACATSAACSSQGVWLHGLRLSATNAPSPCPNPQVPIQACYAPQTVEVLQDAGGDYARITITHTFAPTYAGAANVVLPLRCDLSEIGCTDGTTWARGMFNTAKVALPLDALDAVGEIVRID